MHHVIRCHSLKSGFVDHRVHNQMISYFLNFGFVWLLNSIAFVCLGSFHMHS
jgi:hypothetical protein